MDENQLNNQVVKETNPESATKTKRIGVILKYSKPYTLKKLKNLHQVKILRISEKHETCYLYMNEGFFKKFVSIMRSTGHICAEKSEIFQDQHLNFDTEIFQEADEICGMDVSGIDLQNIPELQELENQFT